MLSQYNTEGCFKNMPISPNNDLIHLTSIAREAETRYPDSTEGMATTLCFVDDHGTKSPKNKVGSNTYSIIMACTPACIKISYNMSISKEEGFTNCNP